MPDYGRSAALMETNRVAAMGDKKLLDHRKVHRAP